jgi:zinc protease
MFTLKKTARHAVLTGATALFGMAGLIGMNAAHAALPIQHWTLANGAQIYLVATNALPIVDVQVDFDAGSRRDPAAQAGMASTTSAMVEKGVRAGKSGEPALDQNALGEAWADLAPAST